VRHATEFNENIFTRDTNLQLARGDAKKFLTPIARINTDAIFQARSAGIFVVGKLKMIWWGERPREPARQ
jgi:hypothetical protein